MFAYIILILVPIMMYALAIKDRSKAKIFPNIMSNTNKKVLWVFFLILFFLLAFRSFKVGTDLANYIPRFQAISNMSWNEIFSNQHWEIGYAILNKLVSIFSKAPQVFLTIVAGITIIPLAILYCRESENSLLSISLFLILPNFCMLFSGLRQAIAIGLGVPAYYLARKKKIFWFLCIVAFAMLFHKSAFILLLLYPLLHVRITKKWLWFVVPCMAIMLLFNARIFNFLLQFLGETYQDRYGEIESTGAYAMIILFVLFAVYAFVVPSASKLDADTIGLRNILLLTVCIQFFAPLNNVAMRMNYYFLIFLPILIPKIANRCKESDVKIVSFSKAVMIVFFLVYFFINLATATNILNIYPYIPFWAE